MLNIYIAPVMHYLVIAILTTCYVKGHPQCLDFTPPMSFPSDHKLPFCSYYRQEGCCKETSAIEAQHERIKTLVLADSPALWENCGHYVQDYLCQQCSPYAAHVLDMEILQNETNPIPRAVPGLCPPDCQDFHKTCKHLIDYFLRGVGEIFEAERERYATAINDTEAFCKVNELSDMSYCFPWLVSDPFLFGPRAIEQSSEPGCLCMQPYTDIEPLLLSHPTFLVNAADGSNRMFVGEQNGTVYILYPNSTVLEEYFLDIQQSIDVENSIWDERGLLGMAFHPGFINNRKFYIYYSTHLNKQDNQSLSHKMRLEEWQVSKDNPNRADKAYRRTILEIYEPYSNHNGGQILFGDDGYLYVFVGDGGGAGDPDNNAQNLFSLHGKALRIDINHRDPVQGKEYSIPPDNPYADGEHGLPEIYAYGLRNPWRCGTDRGDPVTGEGKGRTICGDVGQSAYEELILLEKGANYGWKIREGPVDYCPACEKGEGDKPLTEPIYSYSHSVGKSVTGGQFYRGRDSPSLNGQYIYGDYENGQLYSLELNKATESWTNKQMAMCTDDLCPSPLSNNYSTFMVAFGEDEKDMPSFPDKKSGDLTKIIRRLEEISGDLP